MFQLIVKQHKDVLTSQDCSPAVSKLIDCETTQRCVNITGL